MALVDVALAAVVLVSQNYLGPQMKNYRYGYLHMVLNSHWCYGHKLEISLVPVAQLFLGPLSLVDVMIFVEAAGVALLVVAVVCEGMVVGWMQTGLQNLA